MFYSGNNLYIKWHIQNHFVKTTTSVFSELTKRILRLQIMSILQF